MVVNGLNKEVVAQANSGDRKLALKSRINSKVVAMVEKANLENYYNIAYTKNGNLNKGYIVESIVLDWAGLPVETPTCEVKFFGNDTPNVLVNDTTEKIYIVVAKATCQGAYVIEDMARVKGQRLTLDYLVKNGLLNNKHAELTAYLGL